MTKSRLGPLAERLIAVLLSAAVVPGPPAFVVELMGAASRELDELRVAADRAVSGILSDLVTASAGSGGSGSGPRPAGSAPVQLVVVGAGQPGEFHAAGPVSFGSFGRDISVPALIDGQSSDRDLPTPIMVARYLASRDIAMHPGNGQLWAAARWITTCGEEATALGRRLAEDSAGVGLILVADGAACHGPKAPRAEDPRAQSYDESVRAALASGRPSRLAEVDGTLGADLGATGPQVLPVLMSAARADRIAEVLWAGAPYGVGWAVASWRQSGMSAR